MSQTFNKAAVEEEKMSATSSSTPNPIIVLHENTFEQLSSSSGNITGEIYWSINGQAFPDNTWNDFVVIVLGWWANAIIRLLDGTSTEETMPFMDGPWTVKCKTTNTSIHCKYIDRHGEFRGESQVVSSWTGETRELGKIIFTAGKAALRGCFTKGLSNPDIETLEKGVNRLRGLI